MDFSVYYYFFSTLAQVFAAFLAIVFVVENIKNEKDKNEIPRILMAFLEIARDRNVRNNFLDHSQADGLRKGELRDLLKNKSDREVIIIIGEECKREDCYSEADIKKLQELYVEYSMIIDRQSSIEHRLASVLRPFLKICLLSIFFILLMPLLSMIPDYELCSSFKIKIFHLTAYLICFVVLIYSYLSLKRSLGVFIKK